MKTLLDIVIGLAVFSAVMLFSVGIGYASMWTWHTVGIELSRETAGVTVLTIGVVVMLVLARQLGRDIRHMRRDRP